MYFWVALGLFLKHWRLDQVNLHVLECNTNQICNDKQSINKIMSKASVNILIQTSPNKDDFLCTVKKSILLFTDNYYIYKPHYLMWSLVLPSHNMCIILESKPKTSVLACTTFDGIFFSLLWSTFPVSVSSSLNSLDSLATEGQIVLLEVVKAIQSFFLIPSHGG